MRGSSWGSSRGRWRGGTRRLAEAVTAVCGTCCPRRAPILQPHPHTRESRCECEPKLLPQLPLATSTRANQGTPRYSLLRSCEEQHDKQPWKLSCTDPYLAVRRMANFTSSLPRRGHPIVYRWQKNGSPSMSRGQSPPPSLSLRRRHRR